MIHGHIGKLFLRIPQLPRFTIHVLVTKIKNICQDGFMIIQICIVIKRLGLVRTFMVDFISQLCFDRKS